MISIKFYNESNHESWELLKALDCSEILSDFPSFSNKHGMHFIEVAIFNQEDNDLANQIAKKYNAIKIDEDILEG